MPKKKVIIIYDKDCPACRFYTRLTRVRADFELELINAREKHPLVETTQKKGFDLDEGFVVIIEKKFYYGSEAINHLALISSRSGFFNKLNYWIFKSNFRSKIMYPPLKKGRHLLLKLLSIKKINSN